MVPDRVEVRPARSPLRASVSVPGSKSLTNRALAVAALACGRTLIGNVLIADDSLHFARGLSALGFEVEVNEAAAEILVGGLGGKVPACSALIDSGNAGTAARFLTALAALGRGSHVIDGNARMRERPIAHLVDALRSLGARIDCPTGCPPVHVRGSGLGGGDVSVRGDVSSQYLSALLMVAPYASEPVVISVDGELGSAPYVDMTLGVMADFGVAVEREGARVFRVPVARYHSREDYRIEGDASAASYFFAAAAVTGGTVQVRNVSRSSRQGDVRFLDVLEAMGCKAEERDGGVEVTGPRTLRGVEVNLKDMPDVAQTLAAVAPFAATPTSVSGIASARVKECDRIAATCHELARIGVLIVERDDGFVVHPSPGMKGARVSSRDDHRMAMSLAVIGLRVPGIVIEGAGAVSKTFPRFFEELEHLTRKDSGMRTESL